MMSSYMYKSSNMTKCHNTFQNKSSTYKAATKNKVNNFLFVVVLVNIYLTPQIYMVVYQLFLENEDSVSECYAYLKQFDWLLGPVRPVYNKISGGILIFIFQLLQIFSGFDLPRDDICK